MHKKLSYIKVFYNIIKMINKVYIIIYVILINYFFPYNYKY